MVTVTLDEISLNAVKERFWAKVDRRGPDECWPWQGGLTRNGYGRFKIGGRMHIASRVSYKFALSPIPAGLVIDHLCRTRACVNPSHLEVVTNRVNLLRGDTLAARMASRTHCPQGHPYSDENTYMDRGSRKCRACNRVGCARRNAARSARKAAAA